MLTNCLVRVKTSKLLFALSIFGIAILTVTALLFSVLSPVNAQTMNTINFQGKIVRNDAGSEGLNVSSTETSCIAAGADTCGFQVVYYDASSGGNTLGTETFTNVEIGDYDGVVNLGLGSGSYTAGTESSFVNIFKNNSTTYAEVKFDHDGNATYTEVFARMPVRGAAYAVRSETADSLNGLDENDFVQISPSSVQADSSTSSTIFINKTGASGNILQYQKGGTDVLVLDNAGRLGVGDPTPNTAFTVGTNSEFQVTSGGALGAATGITSSGTITFSGLTDGLVQVASGILSGGNNVSLTTEVTGVLPMANGGTGSNLSDPDADRIIFWDDSSGATTWLTVGSGLSLTDTTLTATGTSVTEGNDIDIVGNQVDIESTLNYVSTITRASSSLTLSTTTSGDIILNPSGKVDLRGSIIPDTDNTYDLGSSSYRFRDIYVDESTIHIGADGDEATLSFDTGTNTLTVNSTNVGGTGFTNWDKSTADDLDTSTNFGGDISGTYNSIAVANNSHTHTFANLTNAAAVYMDYKPNNSECGNTQVLKWNNTDDRWECGDDNGDTYTPGNDIDIAGGQVDVESTLNYVSTITRDSSDLTLSTTTSGDINLNPFGSVAVTGNFSVTGTVSGAGFNGWDTNASDDLTTATSFSGDVTGTYNATVVGNDSHSHTTTTISGLDTGDITTGSFGIARGGTNSTTYTTTEFLWYNGTSIVASGYDESSFALGGHNHDADYIELTDSFSGDVTGTYNATVVGNDSHDHTTTTISGLDISADTNLVANSGIVLTDDTLTHSTANGYGHIPSSGATTQVLQWNSSGTAKWVTLSGDATVADGGSITVANNSHTHTFSNLTNGSSVYMDYRPNNTACGNGQVLEWDNSNTRWICADDDGQVYTAGNDIDINTNQIDIETILNYVQTITRDGGDLTLSTTTSGDINLNPFSTVAVTGNFSVTGTVSGAGFNGWDTNASDDLTTATSFSGDVTGTYNATVVGNDSHDHTTTTISGLDISADTNLVANSGIVLTDDTLTHSTANGYGHIPSSGATTQMVQWNSSGTAKWITFSGDATIADGGAITVANNSHTHTYANLTNSAGVYMNYMPNNSECGGGQVLEWNTTDNRWECADDDGTNYTAGNDIDINANQIDIESILNYVQTITRDSGSLTLSTTTSGDLTLNPVGNVDLSASILPDADDTYDIGSSTYRIQDIFLGPNSLHIGTDGDEGTISFNTTDNTIDLSTEATVNALTLGRGGGGVLTNAAFGYEALETNVGQTGATAIGYWAMRYAYDSASGSSWNTAVGSYALQGSATPSANGGGSNTAIGAYSMQDNTGGDWNTGVGVFSLMHNTTADNNTALGYRSLITTTTGGGNTALGVSSLETNKAGRYSVAVGYSALLNADNTEVLTDKFNTAIGTYAMRGSGTWANNTGVNNTTLGAYTLYGFTNAEHNVAIGYKAGEDIWTGDNNTVLGYQAGDTISTGSNNIIIGYDVDVGSTATSDFLTIGNLIFATGGFGTGTSVGSGNVGIGDSSPAALFTVGASDAFQVNNSGVITAPTLTYASANLTLSTTTSGNIILNPAGNVDLRSSIIPNTDDTYDLGSSSYRIRDLYLGPASLHIGDDGDDATISYNTTTDELELGANIEINGITVGRGGGNLDGNVVVGVNAFASNVAKTENTVFGYNAMQYADDDASSFATNNTAFGYEALRGSITAANNTGDDNTAVGSYALADNTSAGWGTAVGSYALANNTTGEMNTAVGTDSMEYTTTGGHNVALGYKALQRNVGMLASTAIGFQALNYSNDTASNIYSYNTAVGYAAMIGTLTPADNTGRYNTSIGANTLQQYSSGENNTALGHQAGNQIDTGSRNIFVGKGAGALVSSGSDNIVIGYDIDTTSATGDDFMSIGNLIFATGGFGTGTSVGAGNVGIGDASPAALFTVGANDAFQVDNSGNLSTGTINTLTFGLGGGDVSDNTAIGVDAFESNVDNALNVAIGYHAMKYAQDNAVGANTYNTAVGAYALTGSATPSNNTGDSNTAIGFNVMSYYTTGSLNTGVGVSALESLTTGAWNTALGADALADVANSSYNTAVGYKAMGSTVGYSGNTAVGYDALGDASNSTGTTMTYNTAIGMNALNGSATIANNSGTSNTAVGTSALASFAGGDNNVGVGKDAGIWTGEGSNNIYIGANAGDNVTSGSDNIIIGYAVDAISATGDDYMSIGNLIFATGGFGTGTTVGSGKIGIGTASPDGMLNVSASSPAVIIESSTANGDASLEIAEYGTSRHDHGGRLYVDGTNNKFKIQAQLSGSFTDVITINYAGTNANNVGIGTDSPSAKLHVHGTSNWIQSTSASAEGGAIMQNVIDADNSYARAVFGHNAWWDHSTNLWNVDNVGANDAAAVMFDNGANINFITHTTTGASSRTFTHTNFKNGTKMLITGSGAVFLNSSISSLSGSTQTLKINTSTWEVMRDTSSLRYKTDVQDLKIDTSRIYNLRPVSFAYKRDGSRDFGLIAEETYEVIPQLVVLDANGLPDGINYDRLGVLLLNEMIKNQDVLVDLETKVNGYDSRITTIEAKFEDDSSLANLISDYEKGELASSLASNEIPDSLNISDSVPGGTIAYLNNTASSNTSSDVLALQVTNDVNSMSHVYVDFGKGESFTSIGEIRNNGAGSIQYSSTGVSYGEYFPSDGRFTVGMLVGVNAGTGNIANATPNSVVGPIATAPAFSGGRSGSDKALIALAGQVPVLVDNSSGEIAPGNKIGLSSANSNIGSKKTSIGKTVGQALQRFTPSTMSCVSVPSLESIVWPQQDPYNKVRVCYELPNGTKIGKVLMLVEEGWYDPNPIAENESFVQLMMDYELGLIGGSYTGDVSTKTLTVGTVFSDVVEAGSVKADSIKVTSVDSESIKAKDVTAENLSIGNITSIMITADEAVFQALNVGNGFAIDTKGNVGIEGNVGVTGDIAISDRLILGSSVLESIGSSLVVSSNLIVEGLTTDSLRINRGGDGNSSAGTVMIPAGTTRVVIQSSHVSLGSLVLLTPRSLSDNTVPVVGTKSIQTGWFEIVLGSEMTEDVYVDWMVIK